MAKHSEGRKALKRVAELEAEIASLRAQLAAATAEPVAPPRPQRKTSS